MAAALLASLGAVGRQKLKKVLLREANLVLVSGLFGTGHHYYWIGVPAFWHFLGTIASGLQVVPIVLLAVAAWQSAAVARAKPSKASKNNSPPSPLALYFFMPPYSGM